MKMKKFTFYAVIILLFIGGNINAQWTEQDSGFESPWILFDNSFPPGQNSVGFVGSMKTTYNGDGVILKTEDGGVNWDVNLGGTDGSLFGIEAIFFTTLDIGYAAGWDDDIKYTDDGGDTWSDMSVGTGIWYYTDIEFWDEDNGVISGRLSSGVSQVWVTDDGGDSWTAATGVSIGIIDLAYADATTLFAVGSEEDIIESTDGGSSWSLNYDGTDPDNDPLLGVHFYNSSFGVVGGMDGKVLITTNGGSSWSTTQIAGNYPSFYAVHCYNTDSIYVGGTDNIIYKSTDGGNNWVSDNGGGSGTLYQFAVTDNKTTYVSGSSGVILVKEAPLGADFYADVTEVCAGGTVNFTDNSSQAATWDWTFDGGTPYTSTDQNPSVVYSTPGTYSVELTVTDGSSNSDTEFKAAYITVTDTPGQADEPDGDDEVCSGNYYPYTTDEVDFATDYEWELSPADAGTLTWSMNEAELETADDWTGDFTIKVRASNDCGTGDWSDEFSGSLFTSPGDYEVEGGGSYCLGDDGVEVTLSGSDTGIDYELYLDGDATGNIIAGTGSELNFGLQTDEGYYSVVASNDNCDQSMTGQVQVTIDFPPTEPGIPTGDEIICNEESSDYETTGSDDADSYDWILTPEDAGTIVPNGLEANVVWDSEFIGTAYVSVYGINDCGDGNPSEELEIAVNGLPSPEITGESVVCDFSTEMYEVTETTGSTYTWEVTGGTITDGQGTYEITVDWAGVGTGTVDVSEETEDGCEGDSETFDVMIDDCTGLTEQALLDDVTVYPNPARSTVNINLTVGQGTVYKTNVYNTMGQLVFTSEQSGTGSQQLIRIDANAFPQGLYIIHVTSENALLWQGKFEKTK